MTPQELAELKRANDIAEQRLAVEKQAAASLQAIACKPAPMNLWQQWRKEWQDLKVWSMQNHY
jgi:hypothetical protein